MYKTLHIGILCLILIPAIAAAHGPSRQKIVKEIEINAPADKVWSIISEYCAIKEWNPAVTECVADKGSEQDSVRTLTLENGETIKEKLVKHLPDSTKYQYMLIEPNDKAFPINTHGSTITVKSGDGGTTIVEWKGAFYRSFPGPNPPPEKTDEAATKALAEFYLAGLENLKKLAEVK